MPVLKKDGGIEWVKWGKRKEEADKFFIYGGWARLDSIKAGKWEYCNPAPVLIPVESFMEKDHDKKSHWFDVQPNQVMQGLLAQYNDEIRVYVVTTDTPAEYNYIHDRWPRIIDLTMEIFNG